MDATAKKRLCWNCEGSVAVTEEQCPYCGVYIGPAVVEKTTSQERLDPPYRLDKPLNESQEQYSEHENMLTPLVLLTAGTIFLLFSLMLLLFSQHGKLVLEWNADYWYIYLVGSLLPLFFGWRALARQ